MDSETQGRSMASGGGLGEVCRWRSVASPKASRFLERGWLFCLLWGFAAPALSQGMDSTRFLNPITGAVSVTNKGISTIPTFTLGRPAVVFDVAVGGRRLSFEPQLRFALEGKPWSFLFWWRYKLLQSNRFRLHVGAHPALSFVTRSLETQGAPEDVIVARRFLAGEVSSAYALAPGLNASLYYLYSRGLEPTTTQNTHFLGLGPSLPRVRVAADVFVGVSPQIYYLRLDDRDGYYITSRLSLYKDGFPVFVTSVINKTLWTDITASQNFLWNVSPVYAFGP